jgi:hypothetical protein
MLEAVKKNGKHTSEYWRLFYFLAKISDEVALYICHKQILGRSLDAYYGVSLIKDNSTIAWLDEVIEIGLPQPSVQIMMT